jgi:cation transport ATPase
MITGEPVPAGKVVEDDVIGGTANQTGDRGLIYPASIH